MDNVVRLCLEQLEAPQRACTIIRETRSANGAREIAKYSQVSMCFAAILCQAHRKALKAGPEDPT